MHLFLKKQRVKISMKTSSSLIIDIHEKGHQDRGYSVPSSTFLLFIKSIFISRMTMNVRNHEKSKILNERMNYILLFSKYSSI